MISQDQVKHVAKLARLGLTDKEIKKIEKELSLILDYIKKLEEVDTSKVEPTSHPHLLENVVREDIAQNIEKKDVDKLIEAAPEKEKRHIKVKVVL